MRKIYLTILLIEIVLCAESCRSDSDCQNMNDCEDEECIHKDFLPIDSIEIVAGLMIIVIAAISNSAGVGGGPIVIPIMLLLLNFDTDAAIPLTQTVIFGGSVMALFLKIFMRHPTKDRPVIYYSLLMHVQSTLLLGTTFGVILNEMCPSWLILALLILVLLYITYTVARK